MTVYTQLPRNRNPTTPGEMLVEEFLKPLKMTQAVFAEKTGLGPRAINEICRGKRTVTARTAILFSDVLGISAEFWLNCQAACDLWQALHEMGRLEEHLSKQPSRVVHKKTVKTAVKTTPAKVTEAVKPKKATSRKKAIKKVAAKETKKYA